MGASELEIRSRVCGLNIQIRLDGALIIECILNVQERHKLTWVYDNMLVDVEALQSNTFIDLTDKVTELSFGSSKETRTIINISF